MRKLLRRIDAPSHMQFVGGVVKAKTLNAFADYHQVIASAWEEKERILQEAHAEANSVKAIARIELAQELKNDINALRKMASHHTEHLFNQSAGLCVDICKMVIAQVLEQTPSEVKLNKLIRSLLKKSHGAHTLNLECAPSQEALVNQVLGDLLAKQINMRKCVVSTNPKLAEYELKIQSVQGSEVVVSLENLVALYEAEIDALQRDLKPVFDASIEELT